MPPAHPDPALPETGSITLHEALAAAARLIPPGHAVSYGALAAMLGRGGPRQAGRAMAEAEPGTPWWRVVRADGSLPPELTAQAAVAWAEEGTPLRPGRTPRVDLRRASWAPGRRQTRAVAALAERVG